VVDPAEVLDAKHVKQVADALIDIAHCMPTLQSEATTFTETCNFRDGQRTLNLGRHVLSKLTKSLNDIELMLPKS